MEEDQLPNVICEECAVKLESFSEFKKTALDTENNLRSLLKSFQVIKEVCYLNSKLIIIHLLEFFVF